MRIAGTEVTRGASRARFAAIDVARGVALVAMIVYHFAWDLWFLEFVAHDIPYDPAWRTFARTIAASFLILVGIGLVLAHEAGIAWGAFARRVVRVALAAALVSAATFAIFPDAFVYFGILHMIALGSVLALPFLAAPTWLTALAALAILAAPAFFASDMFDTRALAWIGFSADPPPSTDFEPVFPWLAPVLAGIVIARLVLASRLRAAIASWPADGPPARALAWMGRRSLAIYLVHQPILLGILYPLALVIEPGAGRMVSECRVQCVAEGSTERFCALYCACAIDTLAADGLLDVARRGPADAEEAARFRAVIDACAARALEEAGDPLTTAP